MSNFRIFIYDFDNTLFRSPLKPEGWKGGWWGRPESLEEPFVPRNPAGQTGDDGRTFWNLDLLNKALQEELDDHEVWIVTGRLKKRFTDRLREIFSFVGLDHLFDEGRARLCYGGVTLDFKLKTIREIIEEGSRVSFLSYEEAPHVEIYDDRKEHILEFASLVEDYIADGVVAPSSQVYLVVDTKRNVPQI